MAPSAALAVSAGLTARERAMVGQATMTGSDQLEALTEAVAALSAAGHRFALIGGLAVGVRSGVPRATMDVDLAVASTEPRPEVVATLVAAGFGLRGEHEHSLNFRHPSGEPVQVAFDEHFDVFIERAGPVTVGEVVVPVVLADDLIAMKERAARDHGRRRSKALRDLADIELLRGDAPGPDEGW
jgi:predicted nucleotidyltransferase